MEIDPQYICNLPLPYYIGSPERKCDYMNNETYSKDRYLLYDKIHGIYRCSMMDFCQRITPVRGQVSSYISKRFSPFRANLLKQYLKELKEADIPNLKLKLVKNNLEKPCPSYKYKILSENGIYYPLYRFNRCWYILNIDTSLAE